MPTATLTPSRTSQHVTPTTQTAPSLTPNEGVKTQDKPGVVRMTMDEWKRIHRDFKGSHIGPDGKRWRSVLRPGGLVAVEIIK